MGLKETVMHHLVGNMSREEKMEMIEKTLDQFLADMTEEEKKNMMMEISMTMIRRMMGGGSITDPMTESPEQDQPGVRPADMYTELIGQIRSGYRVATSATPEIQDVFEDWAGHMENDIHTFMLEHEATDVTEIVNRFQISESSAYYFLTRLAQKGKVHIRAELK